MRAGAVETRAPGLSRLGGDSTVIALGQLSAFAYPLVSIPYLSRIFGSDGLGHLLLAMSVVNILVLIVDFGFAMSALRQISLALTDRERGAVVSATLTAKVLLLAVGACSLGLLVVMVPGLRSHWQLYLIGSCLTVGALAYPTWLLQGLGRIKTFALFHAGSRIVALLGLLGTVKSPADSNWAIFWQFIPATIAAAASWIFLVSIGSHHMERPTLRAACAALRDSLPLFVGSVATIVIAAMNTVFLGALSQLQQVAFYGAGERLSNAQRGILGSVQQSLLPRVSASVGTSHGPALQRIVLIGLMGAYGFSGLALVALASVVVPWYLGDGYAEVIPVAQLLGLAVCITGVSSALTLVLVAHGQSRTSSRVLMTAALFHLVVLPVGCVNFGALGAAGAVCATETLIACLLIWSHVRFAKNAQHPGLAAAIGQPEGAKKK